MWHIADIPIVERNHGMVTSGFFFTTLAFIAVSLRIVTRVFIVNNIGIDDYFMVAALLGSIGFLTATVHQIRYGLGSAIDLDIIQNFLQALLATVIAYSFTQLTVKFSILFQCKRIFSSPTAQRIFLYFIVWLSLYGSFCLLSSIITCWPVAKYWDDTIPGGCIDRSILHYVLAGFNILNDLALLITPIPFLRKLHIARRAKIVLIGVFACGGFACVVAIVRLHSLYVNNSAPVEQQPLKGVNIAIWSGLEINVAIICACVPALKPLFARAFPRFIFSLSDSERRPRPGRPVLASLPLGSLDHRGTNTRDNDIEDQGIKVHQSFEMKAVAVDADDSSDKNLVPNQENGWVADCYADNRKAGGI